jgi:hypothetical protein
LFRILIPAFFGIILVALPTTYALFPGLAERSRRERGWILAGWLLAAAMGVGLTTLADARLHRAIQRDERRTLLAERRATVRDQFRGLLLPGVGGIPEQYHITVYAPSEDGAFLIPIYPPAINSSDTAIFAAGSGATGKAWEAPDDVFVVKGAAVSNDLHGLTTLQRQRYRMFSLVAATVVRGLDDKPIGVLTAIGRVDDGFFDILEGAEALNRLADGIAWLIPEAAQCMMPQVEETSSGA